MTRSLGVRIFRVNMIFLNRELVDHAGLSLQLVPLRASTKGKLGSWLTCQNRILWTAPKNKVGLHLYAEVYVCPSSSLLDQMS